MKKTFSAMAIVMGLFATVATAQNMSDAFRLSENYYYGTARSIGLGNAVTALGGDLGSIGLNPAGSAVNNYSQFTITPGISVFTSTSAYNGDPSAKEEYGPSINNNRTKFVMPNLGSVVNFETGNKRGLKSISFGFTGNATNYFYDNMTAGGSTKKTSYLGELAAYASDKKLDKSILDKADYINSVYPYTWDAIVAYKAGMISTYDNSDNKYIGITEKIYDDHGVKKIETAGELQQKYGRTRAGNKYDMALNVGFNISDKLYFGGNLGMISLSNDFASYYKEAAAPNDTNFDIEFDTPKGKVTARFSDFRFQQTIKISGSGVYGKFGLIFVPVTGLRLGAAIQTPTSTFIRETYQCAGQTYFNNETFNAKAKSTEGIYEYRIISPYRINVGAAYAGKRGLISIDYEMCDYSEMRYRESAFNNVNSFADVNNSIKNGYGISNMLRLGGEFKVNPELALRAGYNLYTPAERIVENGVKRAPKAYTNVFSAGLGYSSSGSFFCDVAGRFMQKANEYFYPYGNYIDNTASPEVLVKSNIVDIVLTLGWRF